MKLNYKKRHLIRRILLSSKNFASLVGNISGSLTKNIREKNVVIFHPGRCGSSVIGMMLNQHPKVEWIGEIFKDNYGEYPWVWNEPYRFINFRKRISMSSIFGMEIKIDQHFENTKIDSEEVVGSLEKSGFEFFILLKRKNYLSKMVSARAARKVGSWNTKKNIETPKVDVPVGKTRKGGIIERFKKYDECYEIIKKGIKNKNSLSLTYENDVKKDPKRAFKKISDFLDLGEVHVEVKTEKMNNRHVREKISNISEVEKKLRNTKYEWMLHKR
jgi:hypothetical protein